MKAAGLALAAFLLGACDDARPDEEVLPEVADPLEYVDPTIGTGGLAFAHGSCFVGAAAPHGLVKLGPDTNGPNGTINFLHYSGYYAEDNRVQGFSHLHLHGAGATDYGVLSVMPIVAFDPSKTTVQAYETRFEKTDEHPAAGLYSVKLVNGIGVELTATERAGVHHYTGASSIVIDLAKTLSGGEIDDATITVGADEITGSLHHKGGMSGGFGGYTVYFVAKANGAWTNARTWSNGAAPSATTTATGVDVGAVIDVSADVTLGVGVSFVSIEGARMNLADVGALDVAQVRARTQAEWTKYLGVVKLTGGNLVERRIFYTSLYHSFLMPTLIDDVDGTFRIAGSANTWQASGYRQMSDASLWDTYRTVAPLYAWLAPQSAHDQARSLIGFANATGSYPRWPVATGESGTMLGASAEIVFADAALRGVPDLNEGLAWLTLSAAALDATPPPGGRGGRENVQDYLTLGYAPRTVGRSVSTTTEYAHDDFALAQLADKLGHTAERDVLEARRTGWRKLYDPSVGFLRARNADGSFPSEDFDPLRMSDEFAEANAWHSLWMAGAHDADGLAEILGGTDAAIAKLEQFFTLAAEEWIAQGDSAGLLPPSYYWHGNEPDINAAFVFTQLGRRDLADQWQRWIADTHYSDEPAGVAGNDDGGTLGAWYVLSSLGVYPIPGSDRWIVAAPRFQGARITVGDHELLITSDAVSDRDIYVRSIELDGESIESAELTHSQLTSARTLHFSMREVP